MLRGLYTATSGMIAQQRKQDTITNNISNINTPGFKQGNSVNRAFPEWMIALTSGQPGNKVSKPIGRLNTGVLAEENVSIYLQGDLEETKNPFDLAIVSNITKDLNGKPFPPFDSSGKYIDPNGKMVFQPQAFFTVENAAGERRYTRNGKFTVNENSELVTAEGYKVLGQNGQPIKLIGQNQKPLSNVKITEDGRYLDAVSGKELLDAAGNPIISTFMISRVENPNLLVREGNGVYRIDDENKSLVQDTTANGEIQLHQGYIERSNVDPTQSMVDMMAALRAYEANQKMVQFYDKSLEKAVTEVGRV